MIGPLLFLIYVNNVPLSTVHSKTPMFADDSKCYRAIQNSTDSQLLQHDLNSLNKWSSEKNLIFNDKKCMVMRFTWKKSIEPPSYQLNQKPIIVANTQKDLGIIVSNDLKWSNHITHTVAKANRMLGFLRRNCTELTNMHCRRLLYLTLVRSHLSYGSEIWAPQGSSADLVLLEGVQRRATKFILQDYKSSYSTRLKLLNLLPISYWFEIKDLIFFYKCNAGVFEINIDQHTSHPSSRSTRFISSDQLRPNLCRSSSFRSSYFNRIIPLWNNLPSDIKSSSSSSTFKTRLYNHYFNKLDLDFDVQRPRTWKTFCVKCRTNNINCCS